MEGIQSLTKKFPFHSINESKGRPVRSIVLTHCDNPATVHMILKMDNGSVPLKNDLIQHKFKMYMMIFLKVPSNRLGPEEILLC